MSETRTRVRWETDAGHQEWVYGYGRGGTLIASVARCRHPGDRTNHYWVAFIRGDKQLPSTFSSCADAQEAAEAALARP